MTPLAVSACALSFAALASALFAAAPRSARARSVAGASVDAHPVLVLRPCAGTEPWLERALVSSGVVASRLRAGAALRVRFLVAEVTDAAVPIAERAAATLRERGVDACVLVTGAVGPNRKADQIARALASVLGPPDERALVADADVVLDEAVVDGLLAEMRAGTALAWAPPVEVAPTTFADHVSATVLDGSLHAFALLGRLDPRGVVGKCFVSSRAVLDGVEVATLRHCLGEDMELGRRLAARAWSTRMISAPAGAVIAGRTLGAVVARYRRWLTVIRAQRPALLLSYPLLLATTPIALALACVARDARAVAFVLAARMAIGLLARVRSRQPLVSVALALGVVADAVLLVACMGAASSPRVRWRGVSLVARAGHLEVES